MAMVAPRAGAGLSREATLVALLAAAIFINYVDRRNLATAAPLMKGELGLTNAQFGLLTSAFFWVYAPAQLLVAGTVRRFNAYSSPCASCWDWARAQAFPPRPASSRATCLRSGWARPMP